MEQGGPIQVCKPAFISIHGITKSRVDTALTKMTTTGVPLPDLRGRHAGRRHIEEARILLAINNIASYPTLSSHYSTKTNPNSKYLETHIKNKKHMYDLYKKWLNENYPEEDPITKHCYLNILTRNFPHLKFNKIRKDTCNTCDSYSIKMQDPGLDVNTKHALEARHEAHLVTADTGYNLPKKLLLQKPNATIVCMDLQQALPTPRFTANLWFYSRKMYTYNFGIHNYRDHKGYMFLC